MSIGMPNIVGFSKNDSNRVVEYLPHNEQFSTKEDQRAIFFSLYNHYVEKEMRLSKKEIANGANIYEVFKNKMHTLVSYTETISPLSSLMVDDVEVYHDIYSKQRVLEKPLALYKKFSKLIHTCGKTSLFFNLNDMFLHLVYERVRKVNPDSEVLFVEDGILIKSQEEDVSSVLLMPTYLMLDKSIKESKEYIDKQLDKASKILNETEIKQIYLVYPKHPSFTKHITVNLNDKVEFSEEEYRVKMIPYSFSFCTKKQKKIRQKR